MDHKVEILEAVGLWGKNTQKLPDIFRRHQVRFRISIDGIETTVDRNVHYRPSSKGESFDEMYYITLRFSNPLIKKSKDYKEIREQCLYKINEWKYANRGKYFELKVVNT